MSHRNEAENSYPFDKRSMLLGINSLVSVWVKFRSIGEIGARSTLVSQIEVLDTLVGLYTRAVEESTHRSVAIVLEEKYISVLAGLVGTLEGLQESSAVSPAPSDNTDHVVAAIGELSGRFLGMLPEAFKKARGEIEGKLISPVDPIDISWNVFRLFEKQDSEVYWSRWIGNILNAEHGKLSSQVFWRALCFAVSHARPPECDSCRAEGLLDPGILASARDWQEAYGSSELMVECESGYGNLGRLDLLIQTAKLIVIIENKLWEPWHDRESEKLGPSRQADRYREIGRKLRAQTEKKIALVIVSANELARGGTGGYRVPPDWVSLHWSDVGRALREELDFAFKEPTGLTQEQKVLHLWPLVLTLVSIEQDILGFELSRQMMDEGEPTTRKLKSLREFTRYLGRWSDGQSRMVR